MDLGAIGDLGVLFILTHALERDIRHEFANTLTQCAKDIIVLENFFVAKAFLVSSVCRFLESISINSCLFSFDSLFSRD